MATELDVFHDALRRTEQFEGGWSNDPLDRGGETKYGITQKTWDSWLRNPASFKYGALPQRVADISRNMSVPLYKVLYWDTLRCGELLSDDLAKRVFDYGVNSGTGSAIKRLQMAYNLQRGKHFESIIQNSVSQRKFVRGWFARCR